MFVVLATALGKNMRPYQKSNKSTKGLVGELLK
jgi:hypothetical protein